MAYTLRRETLPYVFAAEIRTLKVGGKDSVEPAGEDHQRHFIFLYRNAAQFLLLGLLHRHRHCLLIEAYDGCSIGSHGIAREYHAFSRTPSLDYRSYRIHYSDQDAALIGSHEIFFISIEIAAGHYHLLCFRGFHYIGEGLRELLSHGASAAEDCGRLGAFGLLGRLRVPLLHHCDVVDCKLIIVGTSCRYKERSHQGNPGQFRINIHTYYTINIT